MKNIYFLSLIFVSSILSAQQISYFDNIFRTEYSTQTPYKREYQRIKDTLYFQDFYKEKTLLQEGEIYGLTDIEEINGFIYYSMNRAREYHFKPHYKDAKGHFSFYISNQDLTVVRKYCEIIVENAKQKYSQIWDSKQNEILKNGTGIHKRNPGIDNNKPIRSYYSLPVKLLLFK